jgi:hypothetical protein
MVIKDWWWPNAIDVVILMLESLILTEDVADGRKADGWS